MGPVTVGIDVGQRRDPTAIAVAEAEPRPRADRPEATEAHFLIRHLERLPLGTPYPAVAERVAVVVAGVAERAGQAPAIAVDATGVGVPVVELFKQRLPSARITPVFFTHGDRRTVEAGQVTLGKAFLVSRLQALLQSGRLHLPRTPESAALAQELLDYEIRVDEDANDRYGAFKVGSHDDLVTALGLAVQTEPRPPVAVAVARLDRETGPADVRAKLRLLHRLGVRVPGYDY